MDDNQLLLDHFGFDINNYFNELSQNLNNFTKETLKNMLEELINLKIMDEATAAKGIGYLEKKVTHSINKGLDLLENFSRENFFEIEDIREQIIKKSTPLRILEENVDQLKGLIDTDIESCKEARNSALKARLVYESSKNFKKGVEELNKEYEVNDFENISAKNAKRIENMKNFVKKLQDKQKELQNVIINKPQ